MFNGIAQLSAILLGITHSPSKSAFILCNGITGISFGLLLFLFYKSLNNFIEFFRHFLKKTDLKEMIRL